MKEVQVIEPNKIKTVAIYNKITSQLVSLKEENDSLTFNYEDPKELEEAKRHIRKLGKTKTAIEKTRKAEKQESLEYGRAVDSEAKKIAAQVDDMIQVHQQPIDEISAREAARIESIGAKTSAFKMPNLFNKSIKDIKSIISDLRAIPVDETFEEFQQDAQALKNETLGALYEQVETMEEDAKKAEEAKRVRAVEEEKQRAVREEAIRKQEIQKAEVDKQKAVEAEKNRQKQEQAKKEAEQAAREADIANRKKIHNEILDSIKHLFEDSEKAKDVVRLIAGKKVPHLKIIY